MKKILVMLILVFLLIQPLWAVTGIQNLRDQVKMILARGEPDINDAIIDDFLVLALQNVAVHGLAFRTYVTPICSSQTQNYIFSQASGVDYFAGQGLFITSLSKDKGTPAHRSIWEIEPKVLGQKWLINPPPYQYYYISHSIDTSYFNLYDPAVVKDTLLCIYYYVPITFTYVAGPHLDGFVNISPYFEDIVIEYTLFLCYVRLKDWNSAFLALNKYLKNLSVIRELHINKQPDMTFGRQEIEK